MRNQKRRGDLGSSQELFDKRAIVEAWLGMAKHLRSRPQPRARFDEVAAGRAVAPGLSLIAGARACLSAAAEKDAATLERTCAEVVHYFDTLKVIALRGYEPADLSIDAALVTQQRESHEAHEAGLQYAIDRSPTTAGVFLRELRDAVGATERLLTIMPRAALDATPRRHA